MYSWDEAFFLQSHAQNSQPAVRQAETGLRLWVGGWESCTLHRMIVRSVGCFSLLKGNMSGLGRVAPTLKGTTWNTIQCKHCARSMNSVQSYNIHHKCGTNASNLNKSVEKGMQAIIRYSLSPPNIIQTTSTSSSSTLYNIIISTVSSSQVVWWRQAWPSMTPCSTSWTPSPPGAWARLPAWAASSWQQAPPAWGTRYPTPASWCTSPQEGHGWGLGAFLGPGGG